jgi:hypothetical protein
MRPESRLSELVSIDTERGGIGVILASLPQREQLPVYARLNMGRSLGAEFRRVLRGILDDLGSYVGGGDLVLREHDPGNRPESHELEWLKVSEYDHLEEHIAAIPALAEAEVFTGDDQFVRSLHAIIIVLEAQNGERVLALRRYSAKKELGRSKFFGATFASGQFDRIDEPVFLFEEEADCVVYRDAAFIRHQYHFQVLFQFFEKLKEVADACLTEIGNAVPMVNFDEFAEACRTHRNKLAKLRNIANKPYLKSVTMKDIRQTIRAFSVSGVRVVRRGGREYLEYDGTDKWAVLKLLDDDYLGSIMTRQKYEVNSKRQIVVS